MQTWKENIKSWMEKCSGLLPFYGAPELTYKKPDAFESFSLHNRFSIIQDNEGRGDRKTSNTSNIETQQSLVGSIVDAWMTVWICLSVCQSQHEARAEKFYQIWAGYSYFTEVQKRLHKAIMRQWA